jgi:hypothetical protein
MADRLIAALQFLADSPGRLFAVMLLANAVGQPYAGMVHDSRLYAAQALNTWDGRFADDLFFRYGSQAKFTLFPKLFAPLCGHFGVDGPFWLGYLASTAAFLFASQRLVVALLGRSPVAVAAVILVAATPIPLGGLSLLTVNEPFFSPRIPAFALSLLTVERLLAGRPGQGGALVAAATALHPLVAAPAAAVWALWTARSVTGWSPERIAGIAAVAGAAGVALLVSPDIGDRIGGRFDPDWRGWVMRLHKYTDPANWVVADWFRLAQAVGFATGMAIVWKGDRDRRAVLEFAVLLALAGVIVGGISRHTGCALLFQR